MLPIAPSGCGDLTSALYLAHLATTGSPAHALAATTSSVYAVLQATHAAGSEEIRLIESQDAIAHPPVGFSVRRLR